MINASAFGSSLTLEAVNRLTGDLNAKASGPKLISRASTEIRRADPEDSSDPPQPP
jgi:hypothetical protein